MLEPGTAQILEVPCSFEQFINYELVDKSEAAIAHSGFEDWLRRGGRPPQFSEAVGYKIPLFLGGEDEPSNMEISDLSVYLAMMADLSRSP